MGRALHEKNRSPANGESVMNVAFGSSRSPDAPLELSSGSAKLN
jgi:hypothetical protein